MTKRELNEKVIKYKETRSDAVFTEIYHACEPDIKRIAGSFAKDTHVPLHDFHSEANSRLLRCVEEYKEGQDFINFFSRSLKYSFIDVLRQAHEEESDPYFIDEEGNESSIFEDTVIEGVTPNGEDESVTFVQRKETSKLIGDLVEGEDAETKAYVSSFLAGGTFRSIANEYGTNDRRVGRRIKRLAKNFNPSKHGRVSDYMEVRR